MQNDKLWIMSGSGRASVAVEWTAVLMRRSRWLLTRAGARCDDPPGFKSRLMMHVFPVLLSGWSPYKEQVVALGLTISTFARAWQAVSFG